MTRVQQILGRAQFWLQGYPDRRRPWFLIALGNRLSDFRFYLWDRR